ncbi:hypothetical protein RKE25_22760 (plasmid) [Dyella sp. BiH032]|uniref:hypothetical protein n=1 Tax=Dyella sp. BiH032 TaxID=3075430 RepID=UPI002892D1A1|nr:hypothetical protein [Dyella sp. BiH032]WNL48357.1 hypothetical protein RKE25_22760 [Dyella sp. BiH032]
MSFASQFSRYAATIAGLPPDFDTDATLPSALRMIGDDRDAVFYAPFDHVVESARLVLVGITPGKQQADAAIGTARGALLRGLSEAEACELAKSTASFAGMARTNLVNLLDHVGLAERMGIASTSLLWTSRTDLVHFTSSLRYPVFRDGKNFGGSGITRSPLLRTEIERWFATECRGLTGALFLPLGAAALEACEFMASAGHLRQDQILSGLPHPAGSNGERVAYFLRRKRKEDLSKKTDPDVIDRGRERVLRRVAAWRG